MKSIPYHRPISLEDAWSARASTDGSLYIAGGTDVMVRIHDRVSHPRALVSLRSVPGLVGVSVRPEGVWIGAATCVADLIGDPVLVQRHPVLVRAASVLGSEQIRGVATIGGNLVNASPCADLAGPLLVSEAILVAWSPAGEREIPIDTFFCAPGQTALQPGEILVGILLPPPLAGERSFFFKKGRVSMDLALASVTARLVVEDGVCTHARFAAGSVALRYPSTLV